MHYLYVLKSNRDNKLYIGYTNDLRKRLAEHNSGKSLHTRKRFPLSLIYYEAYKSKFDARMREIKIKKFKNSYTELKKRISASLK